MQISIYARYRAKISLNHHRRIHMMDTSPGTEGSLGPRLRTLGLTIVR
jgi:hypothetical protein